MEKSKKMYIPKDVVLNVKNLIKNAKSLGVIKPHTDAFKSTPVKYEKHKGNKSYFID